MHYEKHELEEILNNDFLNDPDAFKAGRRNSDAVDFSIICWCLGLNPIDKFNDLAAGHGWSPAQYDAARGHMDRVQPFLVKWGTKGTDEAMVYSIDY